MSDSETQVEAPPELLARPARVTRPERPPVIETTAPAAPVVAPPPPPVATPPRPRTAPVTQGQQFLAALAGFLLSLGVCLLVFVLHALVDANATLTESQVQAYGVGAGGSLLTGIVFLVALSRARRS